MGSSGIVFKMPEGRLLGNYNCRVKLNFETKAYTEYANFTVEEYKRPEFEIVLNDSKEAWKYGKDAEVSGQVKYYFGSSATNAKIQYSVKRESYVPWFYWWRRSSFSGTSQEIAQGETTTNDKGEFTIKFKASAPEESYAKDLPSNIIVEVIGREAGGRSLNETKTYKAGKSALLIDIPQKVGFFKSTKKIEIPVRLLNLNEQSVAGKVSFDVFKLNTFKSDPKKKTYSIDEALLDSPHG